MVSKAFQFYFKHLNTDMIFIGSLHCVWTFYYIIYILNQLLNLNNENIHYLLSEQIFI